MSSVTPSTSKPSRRQRISWAWRKWRSGLRADIVLARQQITHPKNWVSAKLASYSLSTAVVLSLATFLVAACLVLDVTYHLNPAAPAGIHRGWLGAEYMSWASRLKYAAAVVTGCGATVALVVNYRKQRDTEQGRFATSFADACAQLGGEAPAVRLGGVYALAALADRQSEGARRQQCIDALCAYLRLPYDPNIGNDHTTTKTAETTNILGIKSVVTSSYRPADREVRLTIIRVVRDHLQDSVRASWRERKFDFTGAVFDGGDFKNAHFMGGRVSFDGAIFSGQVSFDGATFSEGASFDGAVFSGRVSFDDATFSTSVSFKEATFLGVGVSFRETTFSWGACFVGATFSGDSVSFEGAHFKMMDAAMFEQVKFSSPSVVFNNVEFFRDASFKSCHFSSQNVWFDGTWFGSNVSFYNADFSGSVHFRALFTGERIDFTDATVLRGGTVSFSGSRLQVSNVLFDQIGYQEQAVLSLQGLDSMRPECSITADGNLFWGFPKPAEDPFARFRWALPPM